VETTTTIATVIGESMIQVSNQWITYDLVLNQDAFYRPATGEIREYFVPGVDFSVAAIPTANWVDDQGNPIPQPATSGWQAGRWDEYSEAQRKVVLDYLGYKPLYATNITNTVLNERRNGALTTTAIANPWASSTNKILLPFA
jgi:hypothetical protein